MANVKLFGEALVRTGRIIRSYFAAWLMVVVERQVRKAVPNAVDIIVTPLITVLVVSIVTMLAIQPLAGFLSDGITSGINAILNIGGAFAGAVLAGTFYLLLWSDCITV